MKKDKKNILILADVHEGGEWFAIARMLKATKEKQNSFDFILVGFLKKYLDPRVSFKQKIFVQYSNAGKPLSFFKNLYANFRNANRGISKVKNIDEVDFILSSHYLFAPSLYALRFLKRKRILFYFQGIKSVVSWSFPEFNFRQAIVRLLEILSLLASHVIITPSNFSQKYVEALLGPLSAFKTFYIIPNTVPPEFFQKLGEKERDRVRKKIGVSKKQKIILYSGRFYKYKGIENLLPAFASLARERRDTALVIAYPDSNKDEELFDEIKRQANKQEVEGKIKFVADLKTAQLIGLYQISDVLVLPSEIEMAPLVIIESLACSTPCIGTGVGNIPQILNRIEPRLILRSNSPEQIYRKLEFFLNLPPNKVKKLKSLSSKVAQNYSTEAAAEKFLSLIESVEK